MFKPCGVLTMTQDDPRQEVEDRLKVLRERFGDTISVDSLDEIVTELVSSLHGDISPAGIQVSRDLESLVNYIKTVRSEISTIGPEGVRAKYVRPSSDQLDAVVAATEEATGAILDAVEHIETIADNLTDKKTAAALGTEVTKIYEACNFQDITGQRISKVVHSLHHIENKLGEMAATFSYEATEETQAKTESPQEKAAVDPSDEKNLLNGPQLPGDTRSQEEIDALFEK